MSHLASLGAFEDRVAPKASTNCPEGLAEIEAPEKLNGAGGIDKRTRKLSTGRRAPGQGIEVESGNQGGLAKSKAAKDHHGHGDEHCDGVGEIELAAGKCANHARMISAIRRRVKALMQRWTYGKYAKKQNQQKSHPNRDRLGSLAQT